MMMDGSPRLAPAPAALRHLVEKGLPAAVAAPLLSFSPVGLQVERMHFPGGKPVQLQLRATGPDGQSQMLIAEWVGADAPDLAAAEAARLAKPRRGQAASGGPVILDDAATGLLLRRPGFDAKLPGLRLLHDAPFAGDRLTSLGCDPASRIALVAHRLGKRAVLRISGSHGVHYARLRPVTSSSGQQAFDHHAALWTSLRGTPHLAIPRSLQFDPDLGLALFDALPGKPPEFQGLEGFRASFAILRALQTLQLQRISALRHDWPDEMAVLDGWALRVGAVFPDLAARVQCHLDQVRQDLAALPPLPPVACHRDLHEGQILLDRGNPGLLDFDTLRLGDPALDLGNLQAHLILAHLRDGRSRNAFVSALGGGLGYVPERRIGVWRRAALLRLVLIYAFTAEPRRVLRGLIEAAE